MRNWQAIDETERAQKSKNWVIRSLFFLFAVILSSVFLPDTKAVDALIRLADFALLLSWYYSIGKSQQVYVASRFGKAYVLRGLAKPLLAAVLAVFAFILIIFAVAFIAQMMPGAA